MGDCDGTFGRLYWDLMERANRLPDAAKRVGLYGGSFDPIHFGHLILARDAKEQLGLDGVIFIPAAVSPHKLDRPPAPAEARLEMVAVAIEGDEGFEVDDCELRRSGASFTIDTVRAMQRRFPGAELFYLVGDDNLPELHTWKDIEALRTMVRFVVLARERLAVAERLPVIERHVDISSTDVRNRVAKGLSIRYLVPEKACEVIRRNGLYADD
jgi:nicotinate-nucleotide adenylyltransferase